MHRRKGFTLIELMVVLVVISILLSLITVASLGFIERARIAATSTTIKKVSEAIQNRIAAIDRWHADKDRLAESWDQYGLSARWKLFPFHIHRDDVRERFHTALSQKVFTRAAFPITQDDLKRSYWFWPRFRDSNPATPEVFFIKNTWPAFFDPMSYVVPGPYNPNTMIKMPHLSTAEMADMEQFLNDMDPDRNGEQSLDRPGEIFLFALKNAPVFGRLPLTSDDFEEGELCDPDDDRVPELADAWGATLYFYRWPTRLTSTGSARNILMNNAPNDPKVLGRDPDDAFALLGRWGVAPIFHDPAIWHSPLVVSAGPDHKLGLAKPADFIPKTVSGVTVNRYGLAAPTPGEKEALFDSVTNHNLDGRL